MAWDDGLVKARPVPGGSRQVRFANGNSAALVIANGSDPRALLAALGLPPGGGRPVIVVCGGADDLADDRLVLVENLLGPAVASAAGVIGAAVVDGGTAAGVMALVGEARAEQIQALPLLIGVAPAGKVTYPDLPEADGDRTPLEPHHTHFVLADSSKWGGETELLADVAEALADGAPIAMLLAGGGDVARAEAREAARRGWPLFVIEGTGGAADTIAALWQAHHEPRPRPAARLLPGRFRQRRPLELSAIEDRGLREIVGDGDIRRFKGDAPGQLARRVAWELQDEPVLKDAWRTFATYDQLATRMRRSFERIQASILGLGVLATLLALLHDALGGAALHWAVVAAPILAAVLIALANRRGAGKRWVLLRGAAEATKAEIYRYRTRTGLYGDKQLLDREPARRPRVLAVQLEGIAAQLVQTDAGGGPLTPYDGPLPPPMYGASRDDDGLSPLSAARYLRLRIGDQLAYYHGKIRRLDPRRSAVQLFAVGAGGSGAILAAAGLEIWIGLTTAIGAAGLSYLGYLQIDATIVAYNQSATRLASLERGWAALAPGERDAAAFEDLVTRGEAVLTTELGGWVQQMDEAIRKQQARQAEAALRRESQPPGQARDEDGHPSGPA
jgi:hypothetical protein